jgi:hypothetical protein
VRWSYPPDGMTMNLIVTPSGTWVSGHSIRLTSRGRGALSESGLAPAGVSGVPTETKLVPGAPPSAVARSWMVRPACQGSSLPFTVIKVSPWPASNADRLRLFPEVQSKCRPPFWSIISPVMKPASSSTRKHTTKANSSGSHNRPTGILARTAARCSSVSWAVTMGVRT